LIFDTCSVRQKAEDKITWSLKDVNKNKKIWLTWCMVQHNFRNILKKNIPNQFKRWNFLWTTDWSQIKVYWVENEEIKELIGHKQTSLENMVFINHAFNPLFFNLKQTYPNLELCFRIDDTWFLPLMLEKIWYTWLKYDIELLNEYERIIPNENANMSNHQTTAYVPISTWCNQFCSYCIVPYARWLERYFSVEQVVDEVKSHLQKWAKEIVLLWQIVNKHPDFLTIIKEVLKLDWLEWLRYTSPYPTFYSDELLVLHENEEKLCPHIHIPFQSWSNEVLKRMFRGYSAEDCFNFIEKIQKLKRKISITTDIIIWFSWETDEDFDESLKLVGIWKFDMIYMWIYSPRPWTFAYKQLKDDVSAKVKHERWEKMNELLRNCSQENNKAEIWWVRKVLIDEIKWDEWFGHTDNMKQIWWKMDWEVVKSGEFIDVKIIGSWEFKLVGEIIN
jgi:tRNA-2-methylthio-N6-dimethylallyladenosine synthase